MTISPSNITIPMSLGAGYEVDIHSEVVFTGPLAEILTATLTSLDDSMLPEPLTNLRDYLFQNNPDLTTVNLTNIETMGNGVFANCSLTSVIMPNLQTVGAQAFSYNPLTSIELPELTAISAQMFQRCESLITADFLKVASVGRYAFYYCTNLETLILRNNSVAEWDGINILSETKIADGTGYIYVPDDLVSSYQAASGWSDFSSQIRSIDDLNNSGGVS